MFISTRGRYALRVLIDLAEHGGASFVPMKEVAARQDISLKYLEHILPILIRSGIIEASAGKGGGYKLVCKPDECMVGEILKLTEKTLAPVSCLKSNTNSCKKASVCKTLPMWQKFNKIAINYFDRISIQDLLEGNI